MQRHLPQVWNAGVEPAASCFQGKRRTPRLIPDKSSPRDSNSLPPPYQSGAHPHVLEERGTDGRVRTHSRWLWRPCRSQAVVRTKALTVSSCVMSGSEPDAFPFRQVPTQWRCRELNPLALLARKRRCPHHIPVVVPLRIELSAIRVSDERSTVELGHNKGGVADGTRTRSRRFTACYSGPLSYSHSAK